MEANLRERILDALGSGSRSSRQVRRVRPTALLCYNTQYFWHQGWAYHKSVRPTTEEQNTLQQFQFSSYLSSCNPCLGKGEIVTSSPLNLRDV
eukprot:515723-Amphidinium_carterae.1